MTNNQIDYTPLFETLERKGKKLIDILNQGIISSRTNAKFRKNEAVSLDVLVRICNYLDCDIEDIVRINRKTSKKTGFIPYKANEGRPRDKEGFTIDTHGRFYLNRALQERLGCVGKPIKLHIGYDPETKKIGLAKYGEIQLDASPLSFGANRSYASARGFLNRFGIRVDKLIKYTFTGVDNGWMVFERVDDEE
ncbi:helix-turn-helix domain-containing protein [Planifilum fimeticola]